MQLNENGIFVMNLWNGPGHDFSAWYRTIREAFDMNALKFLLSESYRNAIAFGFENPVASRRLPEYRYRAAELQSKYLINFPRYLKNMHWQNFTVTDQ